MCYECRNRCCRIHPLDRSCEIHVDLLQPMLRFSSRHAEQPGKPGHLTLRHEDDFWLVGFADAVTRVPDSLGLRYLDLLVRQPGRNGTRARPSS